MMRYLWDAMVYTIVPMWIGHLMVYLSVIAVPILLNYYGWIWGLIILFAVETVFFDKISMPNVFLGNISSNFYISCGVASSLAAIYLKFVHSYVSSFNGMIMLTGGAAVVVAWYLCMITKPKMVKPSDK